MCKVVAARVSDPGTPPTTAPIHRRQVSPLKRVSARLVGEIPRRWLACWAAIRNPAKYLHAAVQVTARRRVRCGDRFERSPTPSGCLPLISASYPGTALVNSWLSHCAQSAGGGPGYGWAYSLADTHDTARAASKRRSAMRPARRTSSRNSMILWKEQTGGRLAAGLPGCRPSAARPEHCGTELRVPPE